MRFLNKISKKTQLNFIIFGVAVVAAYYILSPTFYYLNKFGGYPTTKEDLSIFGDFIGGTSSLILGILNLIALIYFTYIVQHFDDKRSINQFKYDVYLVLCEQLDKYLSIETYDSFEEAISDLYSMKRVLKKVNRSIFLFNDAELEIQCEKALENIKLVIADYENEYQKNKNDKGSNRQISEKSTENTNEENEGVEHKIDLILSPVIERMKKIIMNKI